jgi:hypothetical protein
MNRMPAMDVAHGADLTEVLRDLTSHVPGVWTLDQLRASMLAGRADMKVADVSERLSFALSCLIASGEAERLGFDSFRIYPRTRS